MRRSPLRMAGGGFLPQVGPGVDQAALSTSQLLGGPAPAPYDPNQMTPEQEVALTGGGSFGRGLRSGFYGGVVAPLQAAYQGYREGVGLPADYTGARQSLEKARIAAPKIDKASQVNGWRDALNYGAGAIGEGLAGAAPALAATALTRRPVLGGMAGMLPQEFGSGVLDARADPTQPQVDTGTMLKRAGLRAGINTALGSIPFADTFGAGPMRAAVGEVGPLGRFAAHTAAQAGTSAAQTAVGNATAGRDTSADDLGEAALKGGIGALPFSGVSSLAHGARDAGAFGPRTDGVDIEPQPEEPAAPAGPRAPVSIAGDALRELAEEHANPVDKAKAVAAENAGKTTSEVFDNLTAGDKRMSQFLTGHKSAEEDVADPKNSYLLQALGKTNVSRLPLRPEALAKVIDTTLRDPDPAKYQKLRQALAAASTKDPRQPDFERADAILEHFGPSVPEHEQVERPAAPTAAAGESDEQQGAAAPAPGEDVDEKPLTGTAWHFADEDNQLPHVDTPPPDALAAAQRQVKEEDARGFGHGGDTEVRRASYLQYAKENGLDTGEELQRLTDTTKAKLSALQDRYRSESDPARRAAIVDEGQKTRALYNKLINDSKTPERRLASLGMVRVERVPGDDQTTRKFEQMTNAQKDSKNLGASLKFHKDGQELVLNPVNMLRSEKARVRANGGNEYAGLEGRQYDLAALHGSIARMMADGWHVNDSSTQEDIAQHKDAQGWRDNMIVDWGKDKKPITYAELEEQARKEKERGESQAAQNQMDPDAARSAADLSPEEQASVEKDAGRLRAEYAQRDEAVRRRREVLAENAGRSGGAVAEGRAARVERLTKKQRDALPPRGDYRNDGGSGRELTPEELWRRQEAVHRDEGPGDTMRAQDPDGVRRVDELTGMPLQELQDRSNRGPAEPVPPSRAEPRPPVASRDEPAEERGAVVGTAPRKPSEPPVKVEPPFFRPDTEPHPDAAQRVAEEKAALARGDKRMSKMAEEKTPDDTMARWAEQARMWLDSPSGDWDAVRTRADKIRAWYEGTRDTHPELHGKLDKARFDALDDSAQDAHDDARSAMRLLGQKIAEHERSDADEHEDDRLFSPRDERKSQAGEKGGKEELTPEQTEDVAKQVEHLRGTDIGIHFDKAATIGGAGSWEKLNPLTQNRLIKIAMDIGLSAAHATAVHEAWHDFHEVLTGATSTPQMKAMAAMLEKYAMGKEVQAKLKDLLAKYPGALKQLEDPHEAVAYMAQFYHAGALKLAPEPKNFVEKAMDWVRQVVSKLTGTVGKDEKVAKFLDAFNGGKFADKSTVHEALSDLNLKTFPEKLASVAPPITKAAHALSASQASRLLALNNPAAKALYALFTDRPGEDKMGGLKFEQARIKARGQYMNRLNSLLGGKTAVELKKAVDTLHAREKPAEGSLAAGVRQLLNDMYKYQSDAKVMQWTQHGGKDSESVREPLKQAGDYFPQRWSPEAIKNKVDDLAALFVKHGGMKDSDAKTLAEEMSGKTGNKIELEDPTGFTPFMESAQNRQLNFITRDNAKEFSPFFDKDLAGTLQRYVDQAVHRAEYTRFFDDRGQKITNLLDDMKYKHNATSDEMETARNAVSGMLGTLNHDWNPAFLQKYFPNWRQTQANILAYENVALLPAAVIANLNDSIGVGLRSGQMKDAWRAFTGGVKEIVRQIKSDGPSEAAKTAALLGMIDDNHTMSAYGDAYNNEYMGKFARKVNDTFFKYNGMQAWNAGIRGAAQLAGQAFILRHADRAAAGDAQSVRMLKELGITHADVKVDDQGRLEFMPDKDPQGSGLSEEGAKKIQDALFRFVDSAAIRPLASHRPTWGSDPRFMLVWHLKQFTWSFHEVISRFVANEAMNGNVAPSLAMLGYAPLGIATDVVKQGLTGGIPDSIDFDSVMALMVRKMLGLNPVGKAVGDTVEDSKHGNPPGLSLLGPAAGHVHTAAQALYHHDRGSVKRLLKRSV